MDLLCIFVITKLNNTFFSVLVIIVATWIIFVIIIRIFFHSYHELFFSGTLNYFSNVYRSRIIFFIGRRIIFRGIANLSFSLQCIVGLAAEGNWFDCLISFASILKTVQAAECFQRECKGETLPGKETKEVSIFSFKIWKGASGLCESDEVFWTEDLIEETTKRLQDSYTRKCLPKWTVPYAISYLESRTIHAGFRNEDAEHESVPYSEH